MMILNAKRNSETKVGNEIQKIKGAIEKVNEKMKVVALRVERLDPSNGAYLKADLQKAITKLEEVWESELGTLKHELWQTIQAHNHNADLIKHHKDAIDQIGGRMTESAPSPELEHIHGQLLQIDKAMTKEQAKQQQIDELHLRLAIVQQQLASLGPWAGVAGSFPPSVGLPAGLGALPPGTSAAGALAAANPAEKKKKDRTAQKPKTKTLTPAAKAALAPQLRAEAPEFVPIGFGEDA